MNAFPVAEFSCLPLSFEVICGLLDCGKNCLPEPLGCLHLGLSSQLVVVGELVPGLGRHAALDGSGWVRVKTYVRRIVIEFETFTVDVKSDVLVCKVTVELLTGFLQEAAKRMYIQCLHLNLFRD